MKNIYLKVRNRIKTLFEVGYFLNVWFCNLSPSQNLPPTSGRALEIVMLAVSDMRFDPRVRNEALALAHSGYRVKIIVPDTSKPTLAEDPLDWGNGIEFILLPLQAASYVMVYPFLLGKMMLDRAVQESPFAFHCHDLTTSIIGLAAARKIGAICVCDFHEWWSEIAEWNYSKKRFVAMSQKKKKLFKFAERLVMSNADGVITVCDSIAQELPTGVLNPSKVSVIRNLPNLTGSNSKIQYGSLRESLAIKPDQQIVIYQGGVGPSRNLEYLIDALAYSPQTVLVIRGPAIEYFVDGYRMRASIAGVNERLYCLSPVPSTDVVPAAAASGAVAGIYTVAPLCLSWKYALPNKLFEYMAAGLPILTADFPEARKVVEDYNIGIVFDPQDPHSIAAAYNRLSYDPENLNAMRGRLTLALSNFDSEREWRKIVDLYDEIVPRRRAESLGCAS